MTTPDPGPVPLDQAARAAHADALMHMSAATMAQLHRRRHAALAGPARRWRWPLPATALASLLVVAAGLGIGLRMGSETPAVPKAPAVAGTAGPEAGIETVLDDLDQTPDFYVWLASGEADLIAME